MNKNKSKVIIVKISSILWMFKKGLTVDDNMNCLYSVHNIIALVHLIIKNDKFK